MNFTTQKEQISNSQKNPKVKRFMKLIKQLKNKKFLELSLFKPV